MRLYVGNLPYSVSNDELKNAFTPFGAVDSAEVIMDRQTGNAKGFAFVEMPNKAEGDKAIKELNGKQLGGRAIVVNEAKPRAERRM